jgi:hypothetical protein
MRYALLLSVLLPVLSGCTARSDPAPSSRAGRVIPVADRMRIYYSEPLFRTTVEWMRSGSTITPKLDSLERSQFGLLFEGSRIRVLAEADGGAKVIVEEYHGEDPDGGVGRVGWVPEEDLAPSRK